MHRKTCKGCTGMFVALRSDALTCSPRCRKIWERHCREITKRAKEAEQRQAERFEQLCKDVTNNGI